MHSILLTLAIAVISILIVRWLVIFLLSRNDVKVVPGSYKVKKVVREDSGYTYFTLYVVDYPIPYFAIYNVVGETAIDPIFGIEYFIEYKFNHVEDAETYFRNNYEK